MIKVNVTLHTNGVAILTGAVVPCQFTPRAIENQYIMDNAYPVEFGLLPRKSWTNWKDNPTQIISHIDEFPMHYEMTIDKTVYDSLNGVNALTILKDKLEEYVGVGNCEIIDPATGNPPA